MICSQPFFRTLLVMLRKVFSRNQNKAVIMFENREQRRSISQLRYVSSRDASSHLPSNYVAIEPIYKISEEGSSA
jgi:hypothetical protein